MFAFAGPVPSNAMVLKGKGAIAVAACNSAKPNRVAGEAWVVQANATWSATHLEEAPDVIAVALQQALEHAVGAPLPVLEYRTAHRWRYALPAEAELGSLWNADLQLGVCGDWLLGPRVECAWRSGQHLANKVAAHAPA